MRQGQSAGRWEIEDIETAVSHSEDWDLLAYTASSAPMAECWWIKCWWKYFAQKGEPLLVHRLLCDARLSALIPLVHRRGVVRVTGFLFNAHTPYSEIL